MGQILKVEIQKMQYNSQMETKAQKAAMRKSMLELESLKETVMKMQVTPSTESKGQDGMNSSMKVEPELESRDGNLQSEMQMASESSTMGRI